MILSTPVNSNVSKVKTFTVSEPGDLTAPPGSQPWAIAVRLQIQSLLKENADSVKQLRNWLQGMEEYAGYRQLVDEDGIPFNSYTEFCKGKQPWGLGYQPEMIDQMLKELESIKFKVLEVESEQGKSSGNLDEYLRRFCKLVQENNEDDQLIDTNRIAEVLDTVPSNAHIWRKRWLDLGWIEKLPQQKRGCYQVTESGRKVLKEWSEQSASKDNKPLWVTIPRSNSKKAAEQLIQSLEVEQLSVIYELIGESLGKKPSDANSPAKPDEQPDTEVTTVTEITDVTEVTGITDVAEVTSVTDVTDVTDVTEVTEVTEVTDVTDAADITEVTEVTEVTDVAGVTDVTEVTEVTDATDVARVTDVTDVIEVTDATEGDNNTTDPTP